jgi:hypothetical protein
MFTEQFDSEKPKADIQKIDKKTLMHMIAILLVTHQNNSGYLTAKDIEFMDDKTLGLNDQLAKLQKAVIIFIKHAIRSTMTTEDNAIGTMMYDAVVKCLSADAMQNLSNFQVTTKESYDRKKDKLEEKLKDIKKS